MAVADLRGSGRLDIVTANTYASFSVLLSQGRGAYVDGVTTQVSGTPGCGMLGDFNRDGRPDVALSNGSGVVVLFGTGKASAPFTIGPTTTTNSPFCAVKGDLNNDGIADFLTPVADPPPSVGGALVSYLGNGDGTFRQGGSNQVATLGILAVGDFNGDHKLDYVLSGYLLALGNGDGTFQAPEPFVPSPPLFPFYTGMAVGDLNGDHFSDIVLSENQYGLYILLNDRAGGFQQTVLSSETVCGFFSTDALTIAGVNGDGWPDIVAGCEDGSAGIVLNDGHGSFTFSRLLQNTAPSNGAVPVVGDLNGDGIPDIILLEMNSIAVFTGTGGGAFGAPFYIGASPSPGPPWSRPCTASAPRPAFRISSCPTPVGGC